MIVEQFFMEEKKALDIHFVEVIHNYCSMLRIRSQPLYLLAYDRNYPYFIHSCEAFSTVHRKGNTHALTKHSIHNGLIPLLYGYLSEIRTLTK